MPAIVFFFVAALIFGCLVVLVANASNARARAWYVFFLLSYIIWASILFLHPPWLGMAFLYLLPLLWIALTLRFSFPGGKQNFLPQTGEPRTTQEELRGSTGTREALNFYFSLVLIGLIVLMVFFYSAMLL